MQQHPIPIQHEEAILHSLSSTGICLVNELISKEQIDYLNSYLLEIFDSGNKNRRNGYVRQGEHKFLAYTMHAPHAIKIYTNKHLIRIGDSFCGGKSHVSNHRIFQNLEKKPLFNKPMHWHKDNKIDYINSDGIHVTQAIPDDKGLILIIYLTDVRAGGTQFAEGSQEYCNDREAFSSKEVNNFNIFTANGLPAGTGILYDYRTIHRAQPTYRKKHRRLSLFCQISSASMPKGEPISIHTDLLYQLDGRQREFLNFSEGLSTAPNWPLDNHSHSKSHSFTY